MAWVSPTGHNDPDGKWNQETQAYDDNEAYSADSDLVPYETWSSFLELTIDSIQCSKIRALIWGSGQVAGCIIDLDVFYGGDWHGVYQGAFAHLVWLEKDIPGGAQAVTKLRCRQYNACTFMEYNFHFHEFDFWEEVVGWTGKISGVTNPAKVMGVDVANIAKVKGVA